MWLHNQSQGSNLAEDVINRYIKDWSEGNNSQLEVFKHDNMTHLHLVLDKNKTISLADILKMEKLKAINKMLETLPNFSMLETLPKYLVQADGEIVAVGIAESVLAFIIRNEKQPTRTQLSDG